MRRLLAAAIAALSLTGAASPAVAVVPADNGTNAAVAWALGYTGEGQTIAIIDAGVDAAHPWFRAGNIAEEACFTRQTINLLPLCGPELRAFGPGTALPLRADGRKDRFTDHGMQVTGAAVGASSRREGFPRGPRGIAPDARVVAVKNTSEVEKTGARVNELEANVRALEWLAEDRSRELAVVNMSWDLEAIPDADGNPIVDFGTRRGNCDAAARDDLWTRRAVRAITTLRSRGVVSVAAASNDTDEPVGFPACLSNVVAVGAVTRDGRIPSRLPKWPAIDVFATGVDMLLPRIVGTHVPATGASFATATVSGAIALYRQAHPGASPDEIVQQLKKTGKRIRVGTSIRRVLQVDDFLGIKLPTGRLRPDCLQPQFLVRSGTVRGFFRLTCAPSDRPLHRIAVTLDGPGESLEAEDLDVRPQPFESYQDDVVTIGPPASPATPGGYRLCALMYTTAVQVWPAKTVCRDYEI